MECDDCGTPLTACWAKGSHARHPYYHCPQKGCASYGKSIRRADIEGEVETLLGTVKPHEAAFQTVRKLFETLWTLRIEHAEKQSHDHRARLAKLDKQVDQLLDRVMDASVPSVIARYEDRIRALENEKLLVADKVVESTTPKSTFEASLRTALEFLANPWILWRSNRLEDKQTVLKLTFADRLRYSRKDGLRTANLSFPFKVLGDFAAGNLEMARLEEETSNAQFDELFENLADWNEQLKHIDLESLDDPQAPPPLVEFEEPQP